MYYFNKKLDAVNSQVKLLIEIKTFPLLNNKNLKMNPIKLPNTLVQWKGKDLIPFYGRYDNGSIAIQLMDSDEPYAIITSAHPLVHVTDDEVFIKTWSGHEDIIEPLRKAGIIGNLLKTHDGGYVTYEIYQLLKKPTDLPKR